MTVSVVGTAVVATVDSVGRFELRGVPTGDVQLRFSAEGVDAKLVLSQVGDQEQIDIKVTVTSTAVSLDTCQRTKNDSKTELSGTVSALSGACPEVTFTLNGTTVHATALTAFPGGACGAVQNGANVEVKGVTQPDGSITALMVHLKAFELEGTVSGLSGTCPVVTFTLNGMTVKTTAQTEFKDGGCSALQNGAKAEVKGLKQPDGSLIALAVGVEGAELRGFVLGLSGTCPTVTFTLNGTTVKTTAQTEFKDGGCSALQNGAKAEVEGLKQPDGSVTALVVSVEAMELEGIVSGISGTCPTSTFTLSGRTVKTTAATEYAKGSCSDIKNGTRLDLKGLKQPDGSVTAVWIKFD
jgi:cyanate lyase